MSNPRIRHLVRTVVDEARALVLDLEARGKFISKHYSYPHLSTYDGGLPNVGHGTGPPDWSEPFKYRGGGDYEIGYDQVPSLPALTQYVLSSEQIAERILLPREGGDEETRRRFNEISVALLPFDLLDRLVLRHGADFDELAFETEWMPLERWLQSDGPLGVEVVVPLAMITCECDDEIALDDQVRLVRLSDDEHRARVPVRLMVTDAHPCVVSAATHALVFTGLHLRGLNRWLTHRELPELLDTTPIDRTLQGLQLAANMPLGYAQVYLRPVGWAWDYDADLLPLIDGKIARRYPPAYNDYAWNRAPQTLTSEALDTAPQLLTALAEASPRLSLAARRFGQAQLRDDDDDAVLDACIALEAAFGDSGPEMTYKISMRIAALLAGEADAERIRTLVTRLYGWRSKLAHGDDATKARRTFVKDTGLTEAQAKDAAVALAGRCLAAILRHPDLGSGPELDTFILSRQKEAAFKRRDA